MKLTDCQTSYGNGWGFKLPVLSLIGPQVWAEGVRKPTRAAAKGEEGCKKTNEDRVQGGCS